MNARNYSTELPRTRTLISGLLLALALDSDSCWTARGEATNESLSFFVVKAEKFEGARFIDTTNCPRLGFVAEKPDLLITNLVGVWRSKGSDFAIMVDEKGIEKTVPSHPGPTLGIKLTVEDAAKFKALTGRNVGNRIMIKFGDEILNAPKVDFPIETGEVAIGFGTDSQLNAVEPRLKKLVR